MSETEYLRLVIDAMRIVENYATARQACREHAANKATFLAVLGSLRRSVVEELNHA